MKINIILPGWPAPIGGFRVIYEYSNQLISFGHQVEIIHTLYLKRVGFPKGLLNKIRRIVGLTKIILKKKNLNWVSINPKIKMTYLYYLNEQSVSDADCIIATAWQTASEIKNYSSKKGKKFYFIMDFYPFMGGKKDITETWKWNFNKIVISDWLLKDVMKYSTNKQKIILIKLATNNNLFYRNKKIKKIKDSVCVMYSKGKYKNADASINVLKNVKKKIPNLTVHIFGKDTIDYELPGWMRHEGRLSHSGLLKLYNKSEIFLSTSVLEGGACPVGEAMNCECAVVTNDTKGSRDYAINNITALVSKNHKQKDLEDKVLKIIKNIKLKKNLIINAKKNLTKFTWKDSARKLERFLINA
jgi:glycosyltransferase involved in cell wall biosynthesis